MRTIALLNQKGGSGKTTTAVNLAATLAECDRRVLLLDFDPSAAASAWLGVQEQNHGLLEVLIGGGDLTELILESGFPGVDIIPSSLALSGAEKALTGEIGAETLLKRKVARLPSNRWNYLLIDCPPTLGLFTLNALSAAREVLIPVEAHVIALGGLVSLMQTVDVVRERLNPALLISGVLACRVDGRTNHSQDVVRSLREKFDSLMLRTKIRESVRLAECPSFKQPITLYASNSPGAEDYRSLAKEIIAQERKN